MQLIIHDTPKRSVSMAKRVAQKVACCSICTDPPSDSASYRRSASGTLSTCREIEQPLMPPVGRPAFGRGVGRHQHQALHPLGVAHGQGREDLATVGIADEGGLVDGTGAEPQVEQLDAQHTPWRARRTLAVARQVRRQHAVAISASALASGSM